MLLAMAWRNIVRNARRSLITISAIAIGLAALLLLWGFNDGVHNAMMRNFQDTAVGSLQIHRSGYFKHPKLSADVQQPEAIGAALERLGVSRWSTRLKSFALAAGADASEGLLVVGMDPLLERRVTKLHEKITHGRFFVPDDRYACILGATTARILDVKLGDDVILLATGRDGALAAERFRLVGIITSGEMGVDRGLALTTLAAWQEMLGMQGRVSDVVARIPSARLTPVTEALKREFSGAGLEVLRWYDMYPVMYQWVLLENGFYYIFLGIVLVVVVAGVLNTVLMSMLERTREFGILMALGSRGTAIAGMVLWEAGMLGGLGTASGVATGLALVTWFGRAGIDISGMMDTITRFYIEPVIFTEINTDHLAITVASVFASICIASLYPAVKASRLEPVEAVRHVG